MSSGIQAKTEQPYPPVRAGGKNPLYAGAMLSNVGGGNSEMSAVGQYFYNSLAAGERYGQIAAAFHSVAVVEMHHLAIFGQLALQFGADPRLWERRGGRYFWWTPAYLNYPREIGAMLRGAVESEKAAVRKYTLQARNIRDENAVANLKRILQDEELHIRIFQNLLMQLAGPGPGKGARKP